MGVGRVREQCLSTLGFRTVRSPTLAVVVRMAFWLLCVWCFDFSYKSVIYVWFLFALFVFVLLCAWFFVAADQPQLVSLCICLFSCVFDVCAWVSDSFSRQLPPIAMRFFLFSLFVYAMCFDFCIGSAGWAPLVAICVVFFVFRVL